MGLGDEEVKYFVGVEEDLFKDWSKDLKKVKNWNKVEDKRYREQKVDGCFG